MLLGFSLSLLVLWVIKWLNEKIAADILKTYLQPCIQLVSVLGLAFFLLWFTNQVYFTIVGGQHGESLGFYYMFDTTYWPWAFIPAIGPIFILALSQSLWWRQNFSKRWLRVTLALIIPIALFREGITIIITSLHQDFLVSSWSMMSSTSFLELALISLAAFPITIWVLHKLKRTSV